MKKVLCCNFITICYHMSNSSKLYQEKEKKGQTSDILGEKEKGQTSDIFGD